MPDPTAPPVAPAASPASTNVFSSSRPAPLTAAESDFITGTSPPTEPASQPDAKPNVTPETGTPTTTPETKPDAPSEAPDAAKPADKPPPAPPSEDDPMDTDVPEGWSPKALRAALKKAKIARRDLYQELKTLKETTSKTPTTPADDPERKALEEKFTATNKRRQELEDHIRFLDYTKSEEYQEKYHKPYVETWKDAARRVVEFKIPLRDPETHEPTGQTRQATDEDLSKIVSIANTDDAFTAAEDIFGTPGKAAFVMGLREAILKGYMAAERAQAEFKEKGSLRQKEWEEGQAKAATARAATFEALNKQAVEKHPELFKPVEGDAEGNALLERGFQQADAAFQIDQSDEKAPILHSVLKNKAAAFDRVNLFWHREIKARKALEEKLAQFQNSEPKPGDGGGGTTPAAVDPLGKFLLEHSRPA